MVEKSTLLMRTSRILALAVVWCIGSLAGHDVVAAPTTPPFSAVCKDDVTHGYRNGTALSGTPLGEAWTTDEHFHGTWTFIYKGGKHITIDDKQAYVMVQHSGVLIAVEGDTNGFASSVWSYAIHLGMKRIVASQVLAAGSLDHPRLHAIKARSVTLKCTFAFHRAQAPVMASHWHDRVRQAQTRLKTLGIDPGPTDGVLGPKTRGALRWFQWACKLPRNGRLDEATRKALGIEERKGRDQAEVCHHAGYRHAIKGQP